MGALKKSPEEQMAEAQQLSLILQKIQIDYSLKIQAAQAEQNWPEVQRLALDMQTAVAQAVANGAASLNSNHSNSGVNPPVIQRIQRYPGKYEADSLYHIQETSVDLETCVYDGDKKILISLLDDKNFYTTADRILKTLDQSVRKELMKGCLRLTPIVAPHTFQILEECKKRLGLSIEIELYVREESCFNAFCCPPENGKMVLGISSALLENFSDSEIAFVMGHEIGHYLYGHYKLPLGYLLAKGDGEFSPIHAIRLYAWKRNAELSADRIGLLACRDFEAAGKAFFKISSGLTDKRFSFSMNDYIQQFSDLKNELQKQEASAEEYMTTHPFAPMRLKALHIFWESETYQKLVGGNSPAPISEEDMEGAIAEFMSFVEPSYLYDESDAAKQIRKFLFMGGFLVAVSNGTVEDSEMAYIGSLVDEATFVECLPLFDTLSPQELRGEVAKIAESIYRHVTPIQRLSILKDLCLVALADGSLETPEIRVLYGLCDLLRIKQAYIDDTLEQLMSQKK